MLVKCVHYNYKKEIKKPTANPNFLTKYFYCTIMHSKVKIENRCYVHCNKLINKENPFILMHFLNVYY